jgi:Suppressor of fused protein (SUFU)
MPNSFISLATIREKLGNPPRGLGFFKPSPLAFVEPPWLSGVSVKDDPTKEIFGAFKTVWKHGNVVWARVIRANRALYAEGADDCPGTVIFSPTASDADAFDQLSVLARCLIELGDTKEPDPDWPQRVAEWWEDLQNDMSYHRGFRLPAEWQPTNGDYKASSVVFHRAHLPGSKVQSRFIPLLVDPVGNIAQIIPVTYWPTGMAEWLALEHGVDLTSAGQVGELDVVDCLAPDPLDSGHRERAYENVFGPIASVYHELVPGPHHIDVYKFVWPEPRAEVAYLSGGMNNAMQIGSGDFSRIELVFYAKNEDQRFAELVRSFAHYPWQTGASIGPWHTIPLGSYAEAALGSDRFSALLFFPGVAKPDSHVHQAREFSSSGTRFLTIIPITQAELEQKLEHGIESLLAKMTELHFDLAFAPDRQSMF